jgi:hypothetical protein
VLVLRLLAHERPNETSLFKVQNRAIDDLIQCFLLCALLLLLGNVQEMVCPLNERFRSGNRLHRLQRLGFLIGESAALSPRTIGSWLFQVGRSRRLGVLVPCFSSIVSADFAKYLTPLAAECRCFELLADCQAHPAKRSGNNLYIKHD